MALIALYKEFRKQYPEFYAHDLSNNNQISQFELDMLLLTCVNSITRFDDLAALEPNKTKKLTLAEKLKEYQRLQVFVDELTDFSPIQLKIMYNLILPQKNGKKIFFGTGDFIQTLKLNGTRDVNMLNWAIPNVQIRNLDVYYRQTKQLTELSQALKGEDLKSVKAPVYMDVSGVSPVMGVKISGNDAIANWIKNKIGYIIYNSDGILPSIAVLVETEDQVEPLARQLSLVLQEFNIKAEACIEGKNLGVESTIRVFCVDHIKGLEFEGVFFVNVDKLEKIKPEAFKNFLYVGASRAAKYFGITIEGTSIPKQLECIKHLFVKDWQ